MGRSFLTDFDSVFSVLVVRAGELYDTPYIRTLIRRLKRRNCLAPCLLGLKVRAYPSAMLKMKKMLHEVLSRLITDLAKWLILAALALIATALVLLYRRLYSSDLVLVAVAFIGSFILLAIAFIVSRYGNKKLVQPPKVVSETRPTTKPQLPVHELQASVAIIEELNRRWAILRYLYDQQLNSNLFMTDLKEQALRQAKNIEDFLQRNLAPDGKTYVRRFLDDEITLLNPMPEEPRNQFLFWMNNRCNRLWEFLREQKTKIGVIR